MTLYGVGLGPGAADLVTVRGREILHRADVVYSPGRLSRSVATTHVPDSKIGDLEFPMTRDEDELRSAWRDAAAQIAPQARDGTAAFVTLGDPNVYSTFGHLRRTLAAFHPAVAVEVIPGVSAVTAFTTALGIEVAAGSNLALREAARGAAPTGPDRMVLFKVTDVQTTHRKLSDAGYDVVYGRRLFMEQGETIVTDDPETLADRDYYTLAYAQHRDADIDRPATAAFEFDSGSASDTGTLVPDGGGQGSRTSRGRRENRGSWESRENRESWESRENTHRDARACLSDDPASTEVAEGEACGDRPPRPSRIPVNRSGSGEGAQQ